MWLSRITGVFAATLLSAGVTTAAVAQPYPPEPPTLSLSAGTITLGEEVTLSGEGFEPNETVEIDISYRAIAAGPPESTRSGSAGITLVGYQLPAVAGLAQILIVTDSDGNFSTILRPTQVGQAVIVVTGTESGLTASVVLTVLAPGLPSTGDSFVQQIAAGTALVAAGVLAVVVAMAWRRKVNRREQGTDSQQSVKV